MRFIIKSVIGIGLVALNTEGLEQQIVSGRDQIVQTNSMGDTVQTNSVGGAISKVGDKKAKEAVERRSRTIKSEIQQVFRIFESEMRDGLFGGMFSIELIKKRLEIEKQTLVNKYPDITRADEEEIKTAFDSFFAAIPLTMGLTNILNEANKRFMDKDKSLELLTTSVDPMMKEIVKLAPRMIAPLENGLIMELKRRAGLVDDKDTDEQRNTKTVMYMLSAHREEWFVALKLHKNDMTFVEIKQEFEKIQSDIMKSCSHLTSTLVCEQFSILLHEDVYRPSVETIAEFLNELKTTMADLKARAGKIKQSLETGDDLDHALAPLRSELSTILTVLQDGKNYNLTLEHQLEEQLTADSVEHGGPSIDYGLPFFFYNEDTALDMLAAWISNQ